MNKIVVYRDPDFLTLGAVRTAEEAAERASNAASQAADDAAAAVLAAQQAQADASTADGKADTAANAAAVADGKAVAAANAASIADGKAVVADGKAVAAASAAAVADGKAVAAQAVIDSQVTPAQLRKNTLDATRAPLPTDDVSQGYAPGSRWLWQGQEWVLADASSGMARWLSVTEITPELFGAGLTGDDAPAFRAAIALLASRGGGVLRLREATYNLVSLETRTAWVSTAASDGVLVPTDARAPFFVPAGVSIRGPGRAVCLLDCSGAASTMSAGIALWDYSDGEISGFRVKGRGANSGAAHGLHLSFISSNAPHVNRNIMLRDLHIHDWASYGIGHQYGAPVNVTVEDVLIEDTGADGVDWKVRFGPGDPMDAASGVILDRVIVRRPGRRVATAISGLGIRGRALLSNIEVTGLKTGCTGIEMDPGIGSGQEFRQPAARSSVSNFYVEGDDPGTAVIGLHLFASGPLVVSNGYIRGAQVKCSPAESPSPFGFDEGPTINAVTVEGTRGYDGFWVRTPRTQMVGCRSFADKAYFEAKRGNLEAGQTVLTVPGGITGQVIVQKNGAILSSGYSASGDTVILTTPAIASDVFAVIQPSNRPYRIEALYCSITGGGCDPHHAVMDGLLSSGAVQAATMITGFYDERFPGVQVRQAAAAIIEVISQNTNEDIRLAPKGTGAIRLGTQHTATADTAVTGYVTIKDGSGAVRKLAVIS